MKEVVNVLIFIGISFLPEIKLLFNNSKHLTKLSSEENSKEKMKTFGSEQQNCKLAYSYG